MDSALRNYGLVVACIVSVSMEINASDHADDGHTLNPSRGRVVSSPDGHLTAPIEIWQSGDEHPRVRWVLVVPLKDHAGATVAYRLVEPVPAGYSWQWCYQTEK